MENAIPALVIAAILVVGGVMIADVTGSSVTNVNDSYRQIEAISEERLGTELSVASTNVLNGGADVEFVLDNEGRTPIQEFSLMDVIINYEGTDDQRYAAWLPYTEDDPPGDLQWTVTSISGDYRNPYDVDSGESVTIQMHLNPPTKSGPDRWVVLATQTGVTYSIYF
jgi:archaellum component FlaF (FlaF/FlaG flagellin family)